MKNLLKVFSLVITSCIVVVMLIYFYPVATENVPMDKNSVTSAGRSASTVDEAAPLAAGRTDADNRAVATANIHTDLSRDGQLDQQITAESNSVFIHPTATVKWGMNVDEIVSATHRGAQLTADGEIVVKSRTYFDTIASGLFSVGSFEFDVTFRARPGEATLSVINLDLTNNPSLAQHENLSAALIARHGEGTQRVNDSNVSARLTETTWTTEGEAISLVYLQDTIGQDKLSIEYSQHPSEGH